MERMCEMCSEIATKKDCNGNYFCKNHIIHSRKSEKKQIKRVSLDDDIYWSAVKLGAEINMDVHKFISTLVIEKYRETLEA